MKKCRKCGIEKELVEFYVHPEMFDGHLNICKACVKKRIAKYRKNNINTIRAYDRKRGKFEYRRKLSRIVSKKHKEKNRINGLNAAHMAVSHALEKGVIVKPKICSWCGKKHIRIEGHHQDYSKKLLVTWLCAICHRVLHHGKNKQAKEMRKLIKIPQYE